MDDDHVEVVVEIEHAGQPVHNSSPRWVGQSPEIGHNHIEVDIAVTGKSRDVTTERLIRRAVGEKQCTRRDQLARES